MPAKRAVKKTQKILQSLGVTNMKELRDLKRLAVGGSIGAVVTDAIKDLKSKALDSEPDTKSKTEKVKEPEAKVIKIKKSGSKDKKGTDLKMKNGGVVRRVGGCRIKCKLRF